MPELSDDELLALAENLGKELVRLTGVALEGGPATVGDLRREAMRIIIREIDAARGFDVKIAAQEIKALHETVGKLKDELQRERDSIAACLL